jgi:putative two-component system response regulator
MLSGSAFALIELAEQIALTHHEKWDGSGYPLGLVGDAIPIAGRIVAVADVFDALTHVRPYKPAWSSADAIREITSQAGRHFDPQVVEAFLGLRSQPALAA